MVKESAKYWWGFFSRRQRNWPVSKVVWEDCSQLNVGDCRDAKALGPDFAVFFFALIFVLAPACRIWFDKLTTNGI